jgi:hypothetical protein
MKKRVTRYRKFTFATFAVFSLTIFAVSAGPVTAAVKAGTNCKTAGLTSIASGKTFTCIKSGKKLVWNKGIAVKPLPSPSQKPMEKTNLYEPVASILKTGSIERDLEIDYLNPINWGGLPANSSAEMKFPVTLRSKVDANIIRVLVQHSEGVQLIMVKGNYDWLYVKAGDSKTMDLTIPLSYLQGERLKGYAGGYYLKVFLNYKDSTKREAKFEVPLDYVLPITK